MDLDPRYPPPPSPAWPALTTAELVERKPDAARFGELRRAPISVVLDDVRSLANVGLIFRLCDALRVERLYLCGITGHPAATAIRARATSRSAPSERSPRPRSWPFRSCRGSTERRRSRSCASCAQRGYQAIAVEQAHHSVPYWTDGLYRPPLCLIFGHERAGIAPAALDDADACVEIPVYGMANSLNVAMALGVVGYEIFRQHGGFGIGVL